MIWSGDRRTTGTPSADKGLQTSVGFYFIAIFKSPADTISDCGLSPALVAFDSTW